MECIQEKRDQAFFRRWPLWARYEVTLLLQAIHLLGLQVLYPTIPLANHAAPYVFFTLLVLYLFGFGPAFLAFCVNLLAFLYLYVPPYNHAILPDGSAAHAMFTSFSISYIGLAAIMLFFYRSQNRFRQITRDLKAANDELAAILRVADTAAESLDLDALLPALLRCLIDVMQADTAIILLKEGDHLRVREAISLGNKLDVDYTIPIGKGFSGTVAARQEPLYIEDAQTDPRVINPILKERGIKSMLGVPMVFRGDLIGVLHVDWLHRRPADEQQIRILRLAADRCASAIVNARLYRQAWEAEASVQEIAARERERSAEMEAVMNAVPAAVWIAHDPQSLKITGNRASYDLLRMAPGTNASKTAPDEAAPIHFTVMKNGVELPPEELPIQQAVREGKDIRNYEEEIVFKDGTIYHLYGNVTPLFDEQGHVRGAVAAFLDITALKETQEALSRARAEAEQRAAELESVLASMVDGVLLFDREGKITFSNIAGRAILGIPGGEPIDLWARQLPLLTPEGEPVPETERASVRALRGEIVREQQFKIRQPSGSEIIVNVNASPVRDAKGQVLGVTLVFRDESERAEFERRRQALFEREHRIAAVLQQALVPPDVPRSFAGLQLATRYQPAWDEAEVGGDFYDIFPLNSDQVGVLIGDVAGKGLQAAFHVAAVRHSVRSYAFLEPSPAQVLSRTNDALCAMRGDSLHMVTIFFGVVDICKKTLTYASAGHTPPLLRNSQGEISVLNNGRGVAAGILGGQPYTEATHPLRPGETILFYTDGLTEARHDSPDLFGEEGIARVLAGNPEAPPDELAAILLNEVHSFTGGHFPDDIALIALSWTPDAVPDSILSQPTTELVGEHR